MKSKGWVPTPHPLLVLPTAAEAVAMGEEKWLEILRKREEIIAQEKHDPYRYGWEPPIWKVCDALLGFPWVDAEEAAKIRAGLGFERALDVLLILGGNRSGKSEYASKRSVKVLTWAASKRVWAFQSNHSNSVEMQQPYVWRYLPPEWRKKVRSTVAYISYTQKYGFSDARLVTPGGSEMTFRNYEQDRSKIEGGELDLAWTDELVPPDWVETLEFRIATREGKIVVTFTPVDGYTPTVRMFCDGAATMRESVAFLLPADGGEPEIERALEREDVLAWGEGRESQSPVPAGRKFKRVPRVLKSVCDPTAAQRAVIFFHSSDNPYGNPRMVARMCLGRGEDFIRERFYGEATRSMGRRLTRFNEKVHVVDPGDIPAKGTNYLVMDPSSARNWFMQWWRCVTVEGELHHYLYREWPGRYAIPGMDVPGPWALPDGKKLDGRPGPAQISFGFGFAQYKEEIARLEGWEAYEQGGPEDPQERRDWVRALPDNAKSREAVLERIMDSRPASAPKEINDRPTTLLEQLGEIGLTFRPAPGDQIHDGVEMLQDLLYYDREKPVDYFNRPRLYISRECRNTIEAFSMWTGSDGQRGACKDPVDAARYYVLSDPAEVSVEDYEFRTGGSY